MLTKIEEHQLIAKIGARASKLVHSNYKELEVIDIIMDIEKAHQSCPLKLKELYEADDFSFGHDVFGIIRHLNRETCELEGCFLPRFSKSDADIEKELTQYLIDRFHPDNTQSQ